MNHYDPEFYDSIRDGSRRSAEIIAPLIMRILHPKSVLDVGCGQGVWLNEFAHNGVDDIHGVDGDYVSKNELVIRPEQYMKVTSEKNDLERALWDARSVLTGYDIALHIPAQRDYILLDDGSFPVDLDSKTSTLKRVLERNGVYGGAPEDGQEAIAAISAHRADGFDFLVQTWLAFWWQGTYAGMASYLEKEAECLVNNERCRIYRFKERGAL